MATLQSTERLTSLAGRLRGEMLTPADPSYHDARKVWNGMFDRSPAAIARVQGAVDVVAVVDYARETGTELAVRGGGHSSAGYSTVDGGIVLDFSRMRGVRVDPKRKVAYAQAGALWGDVDRETQAHGLAVPGGQISHTGIAGLTLGGGIGWLSRQHGLTIDNLLSADLVTADGRLVTASASEHPDLFWGLRGGSGNFGVVVSFEYRLHEVGPLVLGGPLLYELGDAPAALRNARDYFADAPNNVSAWFVLTHVACRRSILHRPHAGARSPREADVVRLASRQPARPNPVHGSAVGARRRRSAWTPLLGTRRLSGRSLRRRH
jgi:FAD/FMN-containing dehydrogenase